MRLKTVVCNRVCYLLLFVNVINFYYYFTHFPLLNLPLIMYPIASLIRVYKWFCFYGVGHAHLQNSDQSLWSYLNHPAYFGGFNASFGDRVVTLDGSWARSTRGHSLIWVAGGGFTSCNALDYVQTGKILIEEDPFLSVSVLCCSPHSLPMKEKGYPRIHQSCAIVLEQLVKQSSSQDTASFRMLTLGADDTGASLLLSMIQYLYSEHRPVTFANMVLISPISHFHHMNFPSSRPSKFTEPVNYFDHVDYVNNWLLYLLGYTNAELFDLLRKSQHISASVRAVTPPHLVFWSSTYTFLRRKEFRESFYYDPKAIALFDPYINDPILNPLLKSELILAALQDVKRITIVTMTNSANRDDSLFLSDFLETNFVNGIVENYFIHAAFTGCLRFSGWFCACPELPEKISQIMFKFNPYSRNPS